eukprot:scaffold241_cov229-Prasinococcus_capsulatus_cf.AAC.9
MALFLHFCMAPGKDRAHRGLRAKRLMVVGLTLYVPRAWLALQACPSVFHVAWRAPQTYGSTASCTASPRATYRRRPGGACR